MRILAFTDLHGDENFLKIIDVKAKDVDLIICAGDLTLMGRNQKELVRHLDKYNKQVIMLHGNHEIEEELRFDCQDTNNVLFMHNEILEIDDLAIGVHGGGGFSERSREFEESGRIFADMVKSHKKSIMVFHAPPFNTALDEITEGWHVGSES